MQIKSALRLHPFSHFPGASCLLPGSFWKLTAFPTLLVFENLYAQKRFEVKLDLQGPVRDFTLEQDLERGEIHLFGHSVQGYFRLRITRSEKGIDLHFEKTPEEGLAYAFKEKQQLATSKAALQIPLEKEHAPIAAAQTRLSLGVHKAQDWDLVIRRGDLAEIAPFWMRLAEWLPPLKEEKRSVGSLRVLEACEKLVLSGAKEEIFSCLHKAFVAGFKGIMIPRLEDDQHQGILPDEKIPSDLSSLHFLKRGGEILRSLFFQEKEGELLLLPCLPPEFSAGRLVGLHSQTGDLLDLEWSKKLLRRVIIHPGATREVSLSLQKAIRSFRIRHHEKERGKRVQRGEKVLLAAGTTLLLDRFEK